MARQTTPSTMNTADAIRQHVTDPHLATLTILCNASGRRCIASVQTLGLLWRLLLPAPISFSELFLGSHQHRRTPLNHEMTGPPSDMQGDDWNPQMVPGSARGQPSDRFAYARTSTPRGTPRCGTPRGGGATPRMSGTPRMNNTPRGTPRDGPDDVVKSRQMPFSQVRVPNLAAAC